MTVIVCLDNKNGMLFNRRRQSRDSMVFADMKTYLQGPLRITPFSEKLVAESGLPYRVEEDLSQVTGEAAVFVEDQSVRALTRQAERIIIYRWNRDYPGDFRCDLEPEQEGFRKTGVLDFPGTSHEKITREVFER